MHSLGSATDGIVGIVVLLITCLCTGAHSVAQLCRLPVLKAGEKLEMRYCI